jgi:N-hydroxyarylamine O-acetyltransferase
MDPNDRLLEDALTSRILSRLGFESRPDADHAGLRALYSRWCREVPFDDLRKLIHLERRDPLPLPGDDVVEFFEAWLRWGCGGTCWAGNGALAMLLRTLGFDAVRGLATMLVAPDLPPNHGTVVVTLDGARWLVDASILFGEPLLLDDTHETTVDHGAWGVRCAKQGECFVVSWRPVHAPDGIDCRIDRLSATAQEFRDYHEKTRGWSPFNYAAYARKHVGSETAGVCFGRKVVLHSDGSVSSEDVDRVARDHFLEVTLGIDREIVAQVPEDRPLPPPPKEH